LATSKSGVRSEWISTYEGRAPRYLAVSVFCILFNNGLLIALDAADVHYAISVLISAVVMIPLGFILQSRITFAAAGAWRGFLRYSAVMIFNTPLAWLLLWAIHGNAGVSMIYASPVMTAVLFIWNYLASGWAILALQSRQI